MKALLNRWGRRWIAGLLVIAMLSGAVPTALAQETVPETTAETVPETTAETVPETTAETVPETTAETVPETTAETEPETTAETEPETESAEEMLEDLLLLDGSDMAFFSTRSFEDAIDAEANIELAKAIEIAERISKASNLEKYLSASGNKITVPSGADLILLSYVDPSDYAGCTINLDLLGGIDYYDLVTPVYDTVEDVTYRYSFQGLGGTDTPFRGTIATSSPKPIRTARALFNQLSTGAVLPEGENALKFEILEQAVDGPILANEVVLGTGNANWKIGLSGSAAIGGIIGTMTGGTVTLEAELKKTDSGTTPQIRSLTCTGNPNAGFFCNTMSGATLNATLSGEGSVSVTADTGSAGGFVGSMEGGSLTANIVGTDAKITSVTADTGSAGGLVGTAINSVVDSQTGYTLSDITVTGKRTGGLIGACTGWNNETNTIDLSKFAFADSLTLSGDTAGGVFGALTNSGGTLTIEGSNEVKSTGSAATYGGMIGTYFASANGLSDALEIKSQTVNSTRQTGCNNYGGIIGTLPTTCYVKMDGLTANTSGIDGTFGGLVAEAGSTTSAVLLDVSGVRIEKESGGINGSVTGGLVGKLSKGVLRLDGTITVPNISAGEYKGRIVGENGDGLVYAVSGCTLPTSGDASNIGNWGEVVRLDGTTLTGDNTDGNLFYLDSSTHTLTIKNPTGNGTYTLINTSDFAGYALAYNYDENDVLKFAEDVDSTSSQSVTLTGSVVLTGTGILGIGRDNGGSSAFTGTFNGNGNSITLDIGDTAGKLWARQKKSDPDSHGYLGLFARVGNGAQIQNVTVAGTVKMSVLNGTDGNANENPLRVAGLVARQAAGIVSYNAVTASAAVTVDTDVTNTPYVMQAGMVAFCDENSTLNFTDCNWTSTLTNSRTNSNDRSGGFLAHTKGGITLTAVNCTLSGNINHSNKTSDARVGGLVADIEENSTNPSQITLKNLTVSATVSAAKAGTNNYCGGLLGCHWYSTNVDFGGQGVKGVTVSGASLNAGSAKFGGLVYQATGHWDATANESIKFTGTDGKKTTITATTGDHRGLLVGDGLHDAPKKALYLEVGTWGKDGTAYWIDSSNVQLVDASGALLSGQFDELVGCTTYADGGLSGNDNAIVSLQTGTDLIDSGDTVPNTYTTQFPGTSYSSPQTRYYYNLSNMSAVPEALTTAQQVTTWSASQFAAGNIRTILYAGANAPVTISNGESTDIDLTYYSYYPVTPLSTVTVQNATLTFGYDIIQEAEKNNKQPSDSNHQHYLMQCGLLYNTGSNVTVTDTRFEGTVGRVNNVSGALIYGTVSGTSDSPTTVSLNGVTLGGLRVSGVNSTTAYAPLLINQVGSYVNLTVDTLRTGTGYLETAEDGTVTINTLTAATSLIGNVGSETATNLNLMFSNIALDSRINAETATAVNNNEDANCQVEYNTTKSIFTKATLLNCFQYSADSSGIYNFYTNSDKVTYGVESSKSIQNEGEQYEYYDDGGGYICNGLKTKPADDAAAKEYFDEGTYRPYVAEWNNQQNNRHELNVNKKPKNLIEGCGTYGDPYLIKDGKQLVTLAYYLNTATVSKADGFTVKFNTYVLGKLCDDGGDYHTSNGGSANDLEYVFAYNSNNGGTWANGEQTITADNARTYLLNAYYQVIQEDGKQIIIKANDYVGLGTQANPFSGVIVGKDSPTVFLNVTNSGAQDFGGLIRYSRGSVVKDLTVDYTGAKITMTNGAVDKSVFFGGVVGYCMGGDTIIDNVSVNYAIHTDGTKSVTLGGADRLIAAGGYVGLVGGYREDGYEKKGGGVVFCGILSRTFGTTEPKANESAPKLNDDGTAHDGTGSTYFYRNPYVGRVLDGYACYEGETKGGTTLDNTDKNYTIPDIVEGTDDLTVVTGTNGANYDVTVTSAQGLWLLSAIVNSGAGAMDSNYSYTDVNGTVDAYQTGKPRSGDYDKIGTADGVSDLADEAYWGGAGAHDSGRVSYLVKKFTAAASDGTYYAARVSGKCGNGATNNSVALCFGSATINMSSYGNGFRGIGASFGDYCDTWGMGKGARDKLYRRTLYVNRVAGAKDSGTVITMDTNQHDYFDEYNASTGFNQSAGLFTMFSYADECSVDGLTIGGNVRICMYNASSGELTKIAKSGKDISVGGFAGRTINATGTVTFTNFHLKGLHVYGGTSTGGVFGLTEKSGGTKTITFNETWSITGNTQISKYVTNDGLTGGLIGWSYGEGGVTIEGYGSSGSPGPNWNVDDLTVSIQATQITGSGLNAGGLIGGSNATKSAIQNVNAREIHITGKGGKDYGGLVGGMESETTIEDCKLENVTVDPTGGQNIGGVAGRLTAKLTLTNIEATSIAVSNAGTIGNAGKSGDDAGLGGLVGQATNVLNISGCQVTGSVGYSASAANNAKRNVGGLIGVNTGATTIASSTLSSVDILAKAESVGGLIGKVNNENTSIRNVTLSNVIAAKKETGKPAGLIAGEDSKKIKGYNILADSCKVGYNDSATMENLPSVELADDGSTGLWLGKSSSNSTFVAVAVKGTNQPQKDVGSGTASITYADYPVDQGNHPTGSASPWLDVNPKIVVGGLTLTGNGVGYTTAEETTTKDDGTTETKQVQKSVAKVILDEAKTENDATRKYWNVTDASDTDETFSKFLNKEDAAYLTTYQAEEGATTKVPKTVDFPILVLASNTSDVDKKLWTYIAALTNTADGETAKTQASEITSRTCTWDDEAESFVMGNEPPYLKVTSSKTISLVEQRSQQYDNQYSRFTLLDVKYNDPTDVNSNGFHLYVPVLVKKVLRVMYTIDVLAGTDYYADGYSGAVNYATANFNEPVTALIEYQYERTAQEWNDALNNGEDLLWHYKKIFDLKSNGANLPKGTRLTLVDVATGKAYFCSMTGNENNNAFDCEQNMNFSPLPICDLLNINVADTGTTKPFVVTTETDATVKVGNVYYRQATTQEINDAQKEMKYLSISENAMKPERYFLTIQVPEKQDVELINNLLNLSGEAMVRDGNAPPAVKMKENSGGRYVLYNGVAQSDFTIKTERVGGSGTEMTSGDAIRVRLSSRLYQTDVGKRYWGKYKPADLNHRFTIDLKKVVGANTTDSILGATGISWKYTLIGKDGQELGTSGQRTYTPGELDSFSVSSSSYFNKGSLVEWIAQNEFMTVDAEIILQYGNNVGSVFPARTGENSNDGSYVHAESRVANTVSQLPITANKEKGEDSERYYCTMPSSASLSFEALEYKSGEKTLQLGINSDDDYQPRIIQTDSIYDYSDVDSVTVQKAKCIRYTLELFQKQSNGLYNGNALSPINDYLPVVTQAGVSRVNDPSADQSKMTWEEPLHNGATCDSTSFDFVPLTGVEFEQKGFMYANYMIRLTAVLLEEVKQADGTTAKVELPGTLASDYIIYTNARVLQRILSDDAISSGNST